MDDLMKEVRAALKAKGYKLPTLKTPKARAKFVAKHGYDPSILVNQTIRMIDGTGEGWEDRIRPYEGA